MFVGECLYFLPDVMKFYTSYLSRKKKNLSSFEIIYNDLSWLGDNLLLLLVARGNSMILSYKSSIAPFFLIICIYLKPKLRENSIIF